MNRFALFGTRGFKSVSFSCLGKCLGFLLKSENDANLGWKNIKMQPFSLSLFLNGVGYSVQYSLLKWFWDGSAFCDITGKTRLLNGLTFAYWTALLVCRQLVCLSQPTYGETRVREKRTFHVALVVQIDVTNFP